MSASNSNLYMVNVITGQTLEGWNAHGPGWYRTQAATPDEAIRSVMRAHLANARSTLAFEQRAPLHLRELHTLEQARAYVEGHVPGCHRFDIEARQCPCSKVEPSVIARIVAQLRRTGRATQEQLSQSLALPPLTVRAALIRAVDFTRYAQAGAWEYVGGDRHVSAQAEH